MEKIRVYTLDEVAEILKVTKKTLYHYLKAGKLSAVKLGKAYRVTEENLQKFLDGLALDDQKTE